MHTVLYIIYTMGIDVRYIDLTGMHTSTNLCASTAAHMPMHIPSPKNLFHD